jgi:hypothetical protein
MAAFCEHCGTDLPPGALFCEMCGHPVLEATPAAAEPEAEEIEALNVEDSLEDGSWAPLDAELSSTEPSPAEASTAQPLTVDATARPPRRRWLGMGALVVVALVTAVLWRTRGDQDDPSYQPFWMGTPALAEDFTDPGSGWEVWTDDQSSAQYEGGQLHLTQRASGRMSVSQSGRSFDNLALEVEAAPLTLPPGGSYGLLVAYASADTYTQLAVSEQGTYRILTMRNGSAQWVADWTPLASLQGSGVVRLGAMRDGRSLVFSINGSPLPESIADLPAGDIALFVATSASSPPGGAHVVFDNVKVWVP